MKLDLSRLFDKIVYKIEISETLDFEKLEIANKTLNLIKPVKIEGEIHKTGESYILNTSIYCEYNEYCDRCLKEFPNKIEAVLSGRLIEMSKKKETQDDVENLIYYEGDDVYLEELVISTILLSLPMKSLCDEGCKGLCPVCGTDLNKEQCDCEDNDIDPRLAKLKELLD